MKMRRDEGKEPHNLKLGIVRLGRAAGKTKFCLLDERDINLVHQFTFEARLEVDRDGRGVKVFAFAYIYHKGKGSGQYVQDILWERYCGTVAPGMRVVHKNCITVDNRMENLMLIPLALADRWCTHTHHSPSGKTDTSGLDVESSLYWVAIHQLPYDPADEYGECTVLRYCNSNGDIVEAEDDSHCYYECRYSPCVAIERELREFSICGRCQEARYCGPVCQQRDWANHKRVCREKRRIFPLALHQQQLSPDR